MTPDNDLAMLRAERDLYRRLLDLGDHDALDALLDDALAVVVDVTAAQKGYLALDLGDHTRTPAFWIAHGCSDRDVDAIRAEVSTGIIAEALRTGRTIS